MVQGDGRCGRNMHVSWEKGERKLEGRSYALFTRISTSLNSCGRFPTNADISSGLLTSSFTGRTFALDANPSISIATSFNASSRRAVSMSLMSGCVRANSMAVALPMPEDAPVITMVLPLRRWAIFVDMLAMWCWREADSCDGGAMRGRNGALVRADAVRKRCFDGRGRCMYVCKCQSVVIVALSGGIGG